MSSVDVSECVVVDLCSVEAAGCTMSAMGDSAVGSVVSLELFDAAHSDLTPFVCIKSVVAKKKP